MLTLTPSQVCTYGKPGIVIDVAGWLLSDYAEVRAAVDVSATPVDPLHTDSRLPITASSR
jgi:hypothetical protein